MSYLLGSEYCIQSLSSDVNDVQSAIKDILSKTGKISSVSWKFPDKFACDLNIEDYLNVYKYDTDDSENNQVAHIVLLELIIDRLSLMLQLHCEFIDNVTVRGSSKNSSDQNAKNHNNKTISPCLGLTSKKHWNKMTQLSLFLENLQKEMAQQKKLNKELISEMEKTKLNAVEIKANDDLVFNGVNASQQASDWLKSVDKDHRLLSQSRKSIPGLISKDVGFKSSQTLDTAFKPCESCHISQSCLRETSSILMQILKEESQTTSLFKLNQDLRSMDWLGDKKLLQIKDAFVKDFNKICTYYRDIRKNEVKVREELNICVKRCDQLKQDLIQEQAQMEKERKNFQSQKSDLESQIEFQRNNIKASQTEIHSMTNDFNHKYKQLQKEMSDLTVKLVEKDKDSHKLEKIKVAIADFQFTSGDPFEDLGLMKKKLDDNVLQITTLNSTIQNQKAENHNLAEIEHTSIEKENNLITRLQNLSDQKHRLDEKIDMLENKLGNANTAVKELKNQKASMMMQMQEKMTIIENLQKTKDELTENITELQDQVAHIEGVVQQIENEKQLLIHYPDLDGPLDKYDTGNVTEDIQMQIKANGARIRMLSQQNTDLGNALGKLQQNSDHLKDKSSSIQPEDDSHLPLSLGPSIPASELKLYVSRPASNMSSSFHSASRNRPPRHVTPTRSTNPQSSNQVLQWSTTTQKSAVPVSCVCETCGRRYEQKSDLEVHKDYCAGRRRKVHQK